MTLNISSIYKNNEASTAAFVSDISDSQNSTGIFPEQRIRINSQNYYSRSYIEDKEYTMIKYPEIQNDL